jgi:glutathione peroxidase
MKTALLLAALAGLALTGCSSKDQPAKPAAPAAKDPAPAAQPAKAAEKPVAKTGPLDLTVKDIDGKDADLSRYKGSVVLVVNVASKCGYTPQYAGLEKLYKDRKDKGLVVLGFPSNDFGKQEPGTEADIKTFCTDKYSVDFPMFAKVDVKGEHTCELYKRLAAATIGEKGAPLGEPKWNFTKYLIDRKGAVVAKFDSAVAPDDAKLAAAIDAALTAK